MSALKSQTASTPADISASTEQVENQGKLTVPYVKLLYFMPRDNLRLDLQLTAPTFLFPDETSIKGSVPAFASLLTHMASSGLVGIARMQRTAASECRLVALLPQDEKVDRDGFLEQPGGLFIVPLPFIQEIRGGGADSGPPVKLEGPNGQNISPAVSAAVDLVQSLQFGPSFRYTDLESPGIQFFYSMLQAIALASDKCEWDASLDDMLLPDADSMRVNQSKIASFDEIVGISTGDEEQATGSVR
jgi:hypothetical protein